MTTTTSPRTRTRTILASIGGLVLGSAIAVSGQPSGSLEVKTTAGAVKGVAIANGQIRVFKGIPYAAPPTGDLRWRPHLGT